MEFREADPVVAIHEITNSVTGRSVRRGTRGAVVKQVGSRPATYRVRFDVTVDEPPTSDAMARADGTDLAAERPGPSASLILDDVTDHDIRRAAETGPDLPAGMVRNLYSVTVPTPARRFTSTDPGHNQDIATAV